MAHSSPKTRQIRRLKRQRSIALRMAELALRQRDEARAVANALGAELYKRENPNLVIEKVDENGQNDQADGQNQDGSGLEVPPQ